MSDRDVITIDGDSVTLRATGVGRYVEAVFLGVWIVFWAIGEAVVLAVVGSMLGGAVRRCCGDSALTRLGRSVLERARGSRSGSWRCSCS